MKILEKGHKYKLDTLDGEFPVELTFVKRFRGIDNHAGTTSQEVLRCLIDRVQTLDAEDSWEGNHEIIKNLRLALVLHESRALIRKVEKGKMHPETILVSSQDGHFKLVAETPWCGI